MRKTLFTFQYGSNQIQIDLARKDTSLTFTFQYGSNQMKRYHC